MSESETTILGQPLDDAGIDDQLNTDPLAELVGEGKKYATVEDLAKGALHAQQFIETLKVEKHGVETELEQAKLATKTTEEILAALNKDTSTPPAGSDQPPVNEGLTPEAIAELVKEQLAAKDTEAVQAEKLNKIKQNQVKSWEVLEKHFGSKAEAQRIMKSYVGSNDDRRSVVEQLGGYDPTALLNVLKEHKPNTIMPSVSGDTELNLGFDGGAKTLTWTDAKKLKRDNIKIYNSPQFQAQLLASAKDPNFFNT